MDMKLPELLTTTRTRFLIGEFINNSYDAYAARGLVIGEQLIIKVVIQKTEKEVVIKIKDNGSGFLATQKGKYLELKSIQYAEIIPYTHLGGFKMGLLRSEKVLQDNNASLQYKNRKEEGASVILHYKK